MSTVRKQHTMLFDDITVKQAKEWLEFLDLRNPNLEITLLVSDPVLLSADLVLDAAEMEIDDGEIGHCSCGAVFYEDVKVGRLLGQCFHHLTTIDSYN